METRSEIERWTIHLNQLKAVMESVDVDEIEGSAMQEMAVEGLAELDAEQMIDDQYFDMLMVRQSFLILQTCMGDICSDGALQILNGVACRT